MINVESTAQSIDEMASTIERFAASIRNQAKRMREEKDISIAADVANNVTGMLTNIRLDLLITRPLREMQREIESLRK